MAKIKREAEVANQTPTDSKSIDHTFAGSVSLDSHLIAALAIHSVR